MAFASTLWRFNRYELYPIPTLGVAVLFCSIVAILVSSEEFKVCPIGWLADVIHLDTYWL